MIIRLYSSEVGKCTYSVNFGALEVLRPLHFQFVYAMFRCFVTNYLFIYLRKTFIVVTILNKSLRFLHNKLRLQSLCLRVNDQDYDKLLMPTKPILN